MIIIIFHVFVIHFCISINRMVYSSSYIPFSTINTISISAKRSNFTLVFFKASCYANPGAEENFTGSCLYILIHIFRKFSNTSANNKVLLCKNKSSYTPELYVQSNFLLLADVF